MDAITFDLGKLFGKSSGEGSLLRSEPESFGGHRFS
jgi:hypothetical protein